jgi:hypothetical protein
MALGSLCWWAKLISPLSFCHILKTIFYLLPLFLFLYPMQGEAVAFALGASARMLRVKTLAGVISTSSDKNGQPLSAAEVLIFFYFLAPST